MISIIIPAYNSERTIIALLDSICSSMYLPFEVICVNDGSTDATAGLVIEYRRNHDQVVLVSQENRGPSAARNRGILEASGDWLMFADSDDDYVGLGLSRVQHEITENPNADLFVFRYVEISQSDRKVIGMNQNVYLSVKEYLEYGYHETDYLYIHSMWNKIYRRTIFELSGYLDEDVNLGEDALFNSRYLSSINHINICDTPLYHYYIQGGYSLSHRKKSLMTLWRNYLTIYSSISELFQKYNLEDLDSLVYSSYYFGTINQYLNSPTIDREDEKTLCMMLTNCKWTDKLKVTNDSGLFAKILLVLIKHRFHCLGLLLCKAQRLRRAYRQI